MDRSNTSVVVVVSGYPETIVVPEDVRLKVQAAMTALGDRITAAGMRAVTHARHDPPRDLARELETLDRQGARIALWAASGNAPTALSALLRDSPVRVACAALLCPFLLDAPGSGAVADAAKQFGFANPTEGKSVGDLRTDVPMLVARAGADAFAGLNATLDRFVADALTRDLPLTVINYPAAAHGFAAPDEVIDWVARQLK
ncbi:MAG TPA: hypothetical protein VFA59_04055 [Vicinamibacterales bacterium]|nr:hypothetical protein [Vicinamibacterales bacterium]